MSLNRGCRVNTNDSLRLAFWVERDKDDVDGLRSIPATYSAVEQVAVRIFREGPTLRAVSRMRLEISMTADDGLRAVVVVGPADVAKQHRQVLRESRHKSLQ